MERADFPPVRRGSPEPVARRDLGGTPPCETASPEGGLPPSSATQRLTPQSPFGTLARMRRSRSDRSPSENLLLVLRL
ncbi:hypothetical protein [Pleurocapsa sp. FMAR1]|uniref:hypothetical protein n=1 Tax=Pleurocapsa sp. FMAR1 TaxID=3040204 RepID=UPI0029C969AF|nr:hypothetical protein [Pleurocapsa sp. FMAR1]